MPKNSENNQMGEIGSVTPTHLFPTPVIVVFNTMRQNGRHFAEDIFKCIIVNENG